jgi:integrase
MEMKRTPYFVGVEQAKAGVGLLRSGSQSPEDVSMYDARKFQKLTFSAAAPIFIAYKKTHVKKATTDMYDLYRVHMEPFFGAKRLSEISIQDIRAYQELRKESGKAGASLINHEVNMLAQMLKKAECWNRIRGWYKPVQQQDPEPPKTMSEEDEDRFFKIASLNEDWRDAYLVASLTNNTSASGIEIRNLRLGDINLQSNPPKFMVPDGKNKERKWRTIPLNETAAKQMGRIVERAMDKGSTKAEHFVFPFRVKRGQWDVTRPATKSMIRKQWDALRKAAGMPNLKPHNLRFQCATRMTENGVPDEVIVKVFGWKNVKMLHHYSRPRLTAALDAVNRIDPLAKKGEMKAEVVQQWMPKKSTEKSAAGY